MSHTPGPWEVDVTRAGTRRKPGQPIIVMVVAERGGMPGLIVNQGEVTQRDFENAKLIAAAPDLLAALKKMIEQKGMTCDCGIAEEVFDEARDAIAKAEGK